MIFCFKAEQMPAQGKSGSDQGANAALSSTNPDVNVRVLAVKELLQAVKGKDLKDVENFVSFLTNVYVVISLTS